MSRTLWSISLLAIIALSAAPAVAQATRAPYTEGSVWNLQFIRVKPGLQGDYINNVRATTKALLDEAKRQGLILSYAALDGLREKVEPLAAKAVGGESERRTRAGQRNEIREVVGTKFGRELILRDSTVAGRSGQ